VLTNLIGNAIKFTERGEVALTASLERQEEDAATIRFDIVDTGIGMRPGQGVELFTPFVQADASTTRKYGGTGLGLAICKQLVEMMGGRIGVESRPDQGSTFWFTVVLKTSSPPAAKLASAKVTPTQAINGNGSKNGKRPGRILVADDNPVNRHVALAQLRKLGHQATAVGNGAEAVSAVQQGGYDLVLMDGEMPVMDGYEATRRIRLEFPNLSIIAVTASAMACDKDRCLSEGMNDYISKPVDVERLKEVLAKWLPPDPDANTFDEEGLLKRLLGDRQLAGAVLNGFLESAPAQLDGLRSRLGEADAVGVRLSAHNLSGSAATVSATGLHTVARAMEQAGTADQLEVCGQLLPQVVEEFERFKRTIESGKWA
jgi:CheY-like chemotaxis protein/HPt (histidine-containing phosphotransfer) domain-containing protein